MSIGTNHVFTSLNKDSKALDQDQRLVRLIAKGKDKSPNLAESLCVSIPTLGVEQVAERVDQLLPYVVGMVHDTQDKIIREYRLETGAADINETLFDVDHVLEWLAANATGERLTRAMLSDWFIEDQSIAVQEWLRQLPKLAGAAEPTILKHCDAIKELFVKFADPRASFTIPQLRMIVQIGEDVENDSRMMQIQARAKSQLAKLEQENSELEDII